MIAIPFLAAAEGGLMQIAKETGEQFGFNTPLFISQSVSFVIVAFLLHRNREVVRFVAAIRLVAAIGFVRPLLQTGCRQPINKPERNQSPCSV